MTLETAKRLIDEGTPNKESEAIVRGGMTICETKTDGNRNYQWIKVFPTKNDSVSSIDVAMEKYRNRKQKRSRRNKEESVPQEPETSPMPVTSIHKQEQDRPSQPSFLERLKKKAKSIWEEIDSIIIE